MSAVKLELSRDNGGSWETLAASTPNTGSFGWTVTAPGTNPDSVHVYSARFRVTATANLGAEGSDTSDGGFSLYDITTAVVITQLDATPVEDGVSIRWAFVNTRAFASLELQRSAAEVGPWTAVATEVSENSGVTVAVDRTAQAGQSYFYRLVGTTAGGTQAVFGPVQGTAGAPRAFALSAAWPNPTRGPLNLQFALPRAAKVRLSVLDLQGREVAALEDGFRNPGRYQVRWDGEIARGRMPSGLYFVRFVTPERTFVSRVTIAH